MRFWRIMKNFWIVSLEIICISYLAAGCSLLQNRYADRSRIEEDNSAAAIKTSAYNQKIEDGISYHKNANGDIVADGNADHPLITEANIVDNTVYQHTVAADNSLTVNNSLNSNIDSSVNNLNTKIETVETAVNSKKEEVAAAVQNSNPRIGDTKVNEASVFASSSEMIIGSFGKMPENSTLYVEVVACDPPLVYNTGRLTDSIIAQYRNSNKFRMASDASIKALRSKIEYNDVANGDWSSLASLARAQKYDYVFYGANGKENSDVYLMYYLIRVDSGEIVWESTKSIK